MVKGKSKDNRSVNNSSTSIHSAHAEGLKKVMLNQGGTVTYYFEEERIVFPADAPKGKVIKNTSVLQSSINKAIFKGEAGNRLSPLQVYQLFQDTAWDLGATKFDLD